MKVSCIVAAAGKGKRLRLKQDKAFVMLKGKPILALTLKALSSSKLIDNIIVVVSKNKLSSCKKLVKKYNIKEVSSVVCGGKKRFDSVRNALSEIGDAEIVLVHDGARPFIDKALIKRVILAAKKYKAALPCTPLKQTIKRIDKNFFIKETPLRKFLWEAQTPQGFRKDLIQKAYKNKKSRNATDDSSLVEKLGHKVKIVKGLSENIKITTPEDLELAKLLLKRK